jgi:hypothetical protein
VEPVCRERTDCAKHAQYEDGEKDGLICLTALIGQLLQVILVGFSYGTNADSPLSSVCMTTVANIIWEIVYARLATPAA